jgi:Rod binding domain-containing protein
MAASLTSTFASISSPALSQTANAMMLTNKDAKAALNAAKAKQSSQDFEQVFVNQMFQHMFNGVGEGAFSGGPGAHVWRSFMVDEYSKSFVKKGGIGLAPHIERELLAQQEVK